MTSLFAAGLRVVTETPANLRFFPFALLCTFYCGHFARYLLLRGFLNFYLFLIFFSLSTYIAFIRAIHQLCLRLLLLLLLLRFRFSTADRQAPVPMQTFN